MEALNKRMSKNLVTYGELLKSTIDTMAQSFDALYRNSAPVVFENVARNVRDAESKCDMIRREMEYQLCAVKMDESARNDLISLLHQMDKVPNRAEDVANFIYMTGVMLPENYRDQMREILRFTTQCCAALAGSFADAFTRGEITPDATAEVSRLESAVDTIERHTIKRFFTDNALDMGTRLLLRELTMMLCDISDHAENAANTLDIFMMKHGSNAGMGNSHVA